MTCKKFASFWERIGVFITYHLRKAELYCFDQVFVLLLWHHLKRLYSAEFGVEYFIWVFFMLGAFAQIPVIGALSNILRVSSVFHMKCMT